MAPPLFPSTSIYVAASTIAHAGRGVFAAKNIKQGDVIETCPIIVLDETEVPDLRRTKLHNYYFIWGGDEKHHKAAICLGFGSLYNHSYTPNATYKKHYTKKVIEFIALKDIQKDEEITVNYNYGNPDDKSKLWIATIPGVEE